MAQELVEYLLCNDYKNNGLCSNCGDRQLYLAHDLNNKFTCIQIGADNVTDCLLVIPLPELRSKADTLKIWIITV